MVNIFLNLTDLTPKIIEMEPSETVLYRDSVGDKIDITCDAWDNIRIPQIASLIIDGEVKDTQPIKSLDPLGGTQQGIPPIFTEYVQTIFPLDKTYTISIHVEDAIASNPSQTKDLVIDVESDSLSKNLKIDITEGAGGYTDDHPYLMPANIAVIRGPANLHGLTAHGRGAVRFQDVGGADTCNFYFDDNGLSPLVLIKIDKLNPDIVNAAGTAGTAGVQDGIYITRHGSQYPLISRDVVFGDYENPTNPDVVAAIDSVSCNTKGISDGTTLCIVSIVMNNDYMSKHPQETISVSLPSDLTIDLNTYNKNFPVTMAGPNRTIVGIVNGTAEFGVKSTIPGKYKVSFFPTTNTFATYQKDIEFFQLS